MRLSMPRSANEVSLALTETRIAHPDVSPKNVFWGCHPARGLFDSASQYLMRIVCIGLTRRVKV